MVIACLIELIVQYLLRVVVRAAAVKEEWMAQKRVWRQK